MKNIGFLNLILGIIFLGNSMFFNIGILGTIITPIFLVFTGLLLGKMFLKESSLLLQTTLGLITYLGLNGIILSAVFYLSPAIPNYLFSITPISIGLIISLITLKDKIWGLEIPKHSPKDLSIITLGLVIFIYLIMYLFSHSTSSFLPSVFSSLNINWYLGLLGFIFIIYTTKHLAEVTEFFLGLLSILLTGLGIILYRIGFGYDTFIHQATEKLLLETGTINPKPLMYLGQYVTTLSLQNVSNLAIENIDRLLFLFVVFSIQISIYNYLKKTYQESSTILGLSLLFFTIPFSLLTTVTPQGLSLALVVIFITQILATKKIISPVSIILGLWIATIHPISFIFIAIFGLFEITKNIRHSTYFTLPLASILYPLAFWFSNKASGQSSVIFNIRWPKLSNYFQFLRDPHYNFVLDFVYRITDLWPMILIIGGLILIGFQIKKRALSPISKLTITLIINFLIIESFLSFGNLHTNEATFFNQRILYLILLSIYFLILTSFISINHQTNSLIPKFSNSLIPQFSNSLIPILLLFSTLYISYPHIDYYRPSKFINMAKESVDVVNFIGSNHDELVVLADQMVSAAAIKVFGFDHNIQTSSNESTYFYPIPTGNTLHSIYENVLYGNTPNDYLCQAINYTKRNTVYLVINKRFNTWTQSVERIKNIPAEIKEIGREYLVYKFINQEKISDSKESLNSSQTCSF